MFNQFKDEFAEFSKRYGKKKTIILFCLTIISFLLAVLNIILSFTIGFNLFAKIILLALFISTLINYLYFKYLQKRVKNN